MMLVALVVAACLGPVASEWVEISQNHYRKPPRTNPFTHQNGPSHFPSGQEDQLSHDFNRKNTLHLTPGNSMRPESNFPTEGTLMIQHNLPKQDEDDFYTNYSITENNWNQNKYGLPSNINHSNGELKMKANITPEFSLDIYETVTENTPEIITKKRFNDKEKVSAIIEKVPSKGSIKRVQLSNTPVKSPSLSYSTPAVNPFRRNDLRKYQSTPLNDDYSDEFNINSDIFKDTRKDIIMTTQPSSGEHTFSNSKEPELIFASSTATPKMSYNKIMTSIKGPLNDITKPHRYQTEAENIMERNNRTFIIKNSNTGDKYSDSIKFKNTHEQHLEHMLGGDDRYEHRHEFVTDINEDTESAKEVVRNGINRHEQTRPQNIKNQFAEDKNLNQNREQNQNNNKNDEMKTNTIENLLKLMKVIAETISQNSKRGVNGKVKYLNELKDTLLSSIKARIDATWPDESSESPRRHSRAAGPSARGHVEFPSSESALMTISFLTFAVFLIKLVLQVIQTYKNKAMIMAPLVVATAGRAVRKLRTFH